MKKSLLITSIFVLLFFAKSKSQSFQLLDTTGALGGTGSPAQAIYNFTVDTSATFDVMFNVKNITSSSISVKIKKRVISSNPDTSTITFCVGINCYPATTTLSPAVSIPANSLLSNGLTTDFSSKKMFHTYSVVYTIFNTSTPSDSISTTINYNVTNTAGIKQIVNNYYISNIAPNPASSDISLSYDLKTVNQPASIKIYNMLGTLVK